MKFLVNPFFLFTKFINRTQHKNSLRIHLVLLINLKKYLSKCDLKGDDKIAFG